MKKKNKKTRCGRCGSNNLTYSKTIIICEQCGEVYNKKTMWQ